MSYPTTEFGFVPLQPDSWTVPPRPGKAEFDVLPSSAYIMEAGETLTVASVGVESDRYGKALLNDRRVQLFEQPRSSVQIAFGGNPIRECIEVLDVSGSPWHNNVDNHFGNFAAVRWIVQNDTPVLVNAYALRPGEMLGVGSAPDQQIGGLDSETRASSFLESQHAQIGIDTNGKLVINNLSSEGVQVRNLNAGGISVARPAIAIPNTRLQPDLMGKQRPRSANIHPITGEVMADQLVVLPRSIPQPIRRRETLERLNVAESLFAGALALEAAQNHPVESSLGQKPLRRDEILAPYRGAFSRV
ncbi:MAG: hypothetical protein ABWX94_02505 [Candidatus Saccharimonadales bacterium]